MPDTKKLAKAINDLNEAQRSLTTVSILSGPESQISLSRLYGRLCDIESYLREELDAQAGTGEEQ